MSAFTLYAATAEHNTIVHRRTPARDLNDIYPLVCVPVSGDMLATYRTKHPVGGLFRFRRNRRAVAKIRRGQDSDS